MSDKIIELGPKESAKVIKALKAKVAKREKKLRELGAKSFEAVYIDKDGKPRSDVHG